MQIKEFLDNVCEQIRYKPIRNEIAEELENHIIETKENYIEDGIEEKIAEQRAVEQMGDAVDIGKRLNKIHKPKLEWKLLINTIVLLGFGLLVAVTRNINYEVGLYQNGYERLFNAPIIFSISCIIGILLSIGVYFSNYKKLQKYATITYIFATIIGIFINNFGRIYIPFLDIKSQVPRILPMLLYIISFVGFIQNIKENKDIIKVQIKYHLIKEHYLKIGKIIILSFFSLLVMASISNILILAISYLLITTAKIFRLKKIAKKKLGILLIILVIVATAFLSSYLGIFTNERARNRIMTSFNPYNDPNGEGWIGVQQMKVVNYAKLFGPEDSEENVKEVMDLFNQGTDQAFLSILSNYGWIISIILVATVIIFSIILIVDSTKIKDMYGKLIIIGISSSFILQSIFNILMNVNLGMRMNVNIPFISYGGLELVINIVTLGLVFSIYRRKDIVFDNKKIMIKQEN